MGLFSRVVIFAVFFGAVICEKETKVVQTEQGKVEGKLADSGGFYEFFGNKICNASQIPGIPTSIIDCSQAPKEPPSYTSVYKADNQLVVCAQFLTNDLLAAPSENEDCLVLNIYTPQNTTKYAKYPVMVFIHGGDFGIGSSSPIFYSPRYLLSHNNVIIVTVNYRLNMYGFLNLGIPEAPGNAGLKDIRAALRWIQSNIKNFNGNPKNVTVFGQGSGGVAAIYLTLSESTRGLFHRIISQSGSMFTPQSFEHDGLATAINLAKSLGITSREPKELLELFSNTSVAKIEEAIGKQMHPKSVFVPTVERQFSGEEPFLVDTPFNIIVSGRLHPSFNPVPAIIGLNTVEGLTCTMDYFTITSQMDRIKNVDYAAIDQRNFIVPHDEIQRFRTILVETYFANTTSDESLIGALINLNTDFSFVGPMALFADLYANKSGLPVYQYIFNYIGNRNLGRFLVNTTLQATTNRDELFYIFELERMPLPMATDDARMITFMTMMWTNFATIGRPTKETDEGVWVEQPHHLAIDLVPTYVTGLTPDRTNFWRFWYYKYGAEIARP